MIKKEKISPYLELNFKPGKIMKPQHNLVYQEEVIKKTVKIQ